MRGVLWRACVSGLVAGVLLYAPLPWIPGACVSVGVAGATLLCVLSLGKLLYDTLYGPRGPWGRWP